MIKKIALSCVPLALALCSQTVSAAALMDRWGTATTTYAYSCGMHNCIEPSFGGGPISSSNSNSYHETLSTSQVSDGITYNARAIAEIDHTGALALPHLRGEVLSHEGIETSARSVAIEGFTYSGVAQTVNLEIGLEGSIFDPFPNYESSDTYISSSVYLFTDALAFESVVAPNQFTLGSAAHALVSEQASLLLIGNASATSEFLSDSATISFDLEDGDTFYIYATHLVTSSGPGFTCSTCPDYASATSMNSLNLDITTSSGAAVTGLTANSSVAAVPIPAAVWLMGSALMGLVGFRRRKAV